MSDELREDEELEEEPVEQADPQDSDGEGGGSEVGLGEAVDSVEDAITQVPIPAEKLEEIANWLYEEIVRAQGDRTELDRNIVKWTKLYEAKRDQEIKDFPFPGASNLMIPTVSTAVETVLSRLMGAIFGGKHLWAPGAKSANWQELVRPMELWLDWVGGNVLDMYKVCQKWILGTLKHGTGVLKITWERRYKRVIYMENGAETQEIILDHDGPVATVVPLSDFFVSADAVTSGDINKASWVAHRKFYTWKELKQLEVSGIVHDVERIENYKRSGAEDHEAATQQTTGVEPSEYTDYEVWEAWASVDLHDDGIPSEIVVLFEPTSRTVLSAVYNYYRHQERPFHVVPYMPREDSLFGIGIAEMLQYVQEEVTTMHNQRIDNATIANTKVYKRRRSSMIPGTEVYPGAFLDVDEMEDIQEFAMGSDHSSLLQEELHTNSIGEKRTGVSDYSVGRESSAIGSRATATSTMALIREGNKRFEMTIREMRDRLSDIAHQIIMLYQQFAKDQQVMYELFSEAQGRIVKEFLTLPPEYSRANVVIDTPALSEVDNKEVKQQTMVMLMQMSTQFYQQAFQMLTMAMSPEAPPPVKKLAAHAAKSTTKLFERILDSFDIKDAETFAPDMESLLQMAAVMEQMLQAQQGGMNGGVQGQGANAQAQAGFAGAEPQMGAGQGGAQAAPGGSLAQAENGQDRVGNLL